MGSMERRYAEALLTLSENAQQADSVGSALGAMGRLFTYNAEYRGFILNPVVSRQHRVEILLDTLIKLGYIQNAEKNEIIDDTEAQAPDTGMLLFRFLQMLLDKGRLAFLPDIADEYTSVKEKHRDAIRITVRSSEPLNDSELGDLREKYMAQYGAAAAEIINVIDLSPPGGVSVKIGETYVDDTLYGRLAALARAITAGAVRQTAEAG